ncbi:cellulose biosynthesis cyclic di-GMP-binding regulatory protein BcsB [Lysinibacillus sp. MHQ-1]|nr:cellulose biosynthesis cyclic di-GMP-binding regulatory protein BcsB [Lysinibacillus sp. MHQ-1]
MGYEGYETTVILPKKASGATLNSGYQLAAYLSEHGDTNVQIQREDAVNQVSGPIVIVGSQQEFSTSLIKKCIS